MKEFKGRLIVHRLRVGIVVSRFNELINKSLLQGALEALDSYGVPRDDVTVAWVPGAFEIPVVANRMACANRYDAIICLGAVIRGATPHFDYVAGPVASTIASISRDTGIPVVFGVLTTDTIEQALERAGTKAGNKGFDAVQTAVEMVDLLNQMESSQSLLKQIRSKAESGTSTISI